MRRFWLPTASNWHVMLNSQVIDIDNQKEFSAAKKLLHELLSADEIVKELESQNSANIKQVYTNAATIFALVLQRLEGGLTLKQTVKRMIDQHRDMLRSENRRVQEGTLAENPSAYDQARRTIPLQNIADFCRLVCNRLADLSGDGFDGKRVYILDGTTISLPPTKDIAEKFPTARNQHGRSAWPIMSLLVAHELDSSCCLVPEIGAMYGSKAVSELTLMKKLLANTVPNDCIVMGDSGFGVFAAAHHCRQNGQQFVFSLTKQRFRSHLKTATLLQEGTGYKTFEVIWKPSPKELKNHTEIPADSALHAIIHQLELEDGKTLEVITDVLYDASSIGSLYKHRYDCEFDIRDFKVTMDTESMRARSHDTIMKELYGSVIAYNLVLQFRRDAAKRCGLPPRRLSFSDTWLDFCHDLLNKMATSLEQWQMLYAKAIASACQRVLPDRRGKRTYPRVAYTRRPKTTKFEQSQKAEASKIREEKRAQSLE
jgi:hypothetical protein